MQISGSLIGKRHMTRLTRVAVLAQTLPERNLTEYFESVIGKF